MMQPKLLRVAIGICLGIATLGYGSLEKHVTVRIEGEPVAVRTFAFEVGEALTRAGVDVGPRDRVKPPLDASFDDGDVIDIYRAKTITLVVDGVTKSVVVTSLTVADALKELKLDNSLADTVSPGRAALIEPGMTLRYRQAVPVSITYDDQTRSVLTNATTVKQVLKEVGVKLGAQDKVQPSMSSRPVSGLRIRVLRVGIRTEVREVETSFRTITKRDGRYEYGTRKEIQEGRPGLKRVRYAVKYVDGKRVSRKVLGTVTVRSVRDRIIAIGTGFPGCTCSKGTQTGKATWYSQADGLSAAHRTLPFGTVVRVVNLANGKWVNVVIRDRGPYGPNRIIDLSDEAFRRLAPLGTGILNVRIRW
jgi:resuscitation-promoting factor RpfB